MVLIAAALIGLPLLGRKYGISRERSLARRLGFSFHPKAPPGFSRRLGGFSLLRGEGRSPVSRLMLRSEKGRNLAVFIIQHPRRRGARVPTTLRVFFADSASLKLPYFRMAPESIPDYIQKIPDIDFDRHPAFSRRYLLQGESAEKVRSVFTPPLLDYLARRRLLRMEGWKNRLVVAHPRIEAQRLLKWGRAILEMLEESSKNRRV